MMILYDFPYLGALSAASPRRFLQKPVKVPHSNLMNVSAFGAHPPSNLMNLSAFDAPEFSDLMNVSAKEIRAI